MNMKCWCVRHYIMFNVHGNSCLPALVVVTIHATTMLHHVFMIVILERSGCFRGNYIFHVFFSFGCGSKSQLTAQKGTQSITTVYSTMRGMSALCDGWHQQRHRGRNGNGGNIPTSSLRVDNKKSSGLGNTDVLCISIYEYLITIFSACSFLCPVLQRSWTFVFSKSACFLSTVWESWTQTFSCEFAEPSSSYVVLYEDKLLGPRWVDLSLEK